MDDGQQVKRGGVTLCTDSFNSEEVGFLRESLKSNFNLITTIHLRRIKIHQVVLIMREFILIKIP